jgi:hypothetical protein
MIRKEKNKWHLYSKDGSKHLGGPYASKEEAITREKQVNYWKHIKKASFKNEFIKLNVKTNYSTYFGKKKLT